ncbi:MAG: RidA family protein [Phycisphaerae bacterium]
MNADTRRVFFQRFGQAALAGGAVVTGTAVVARAGEPAPRRRVVPGSPSPAYSRATEFGGLVYVAGCVGLPAGSRDIPSDFADEARQAMENLRSSVEASGSNLAGVLKCTVFLKEYALFKTFNEVYLSIMPEPRPARSTVVVKDFVVPGARMEIDCVACTTT